MPALQEEETAGGLVQEGDLGNPVLRGGTQLEPEVNPSWSNEGEEEEEEEEERLPEPEAASRQEAR